MSKTIKYILKAGCSYFKNGQSHNANQKENLEIFWILSLDLFQTPWILILKKKCKSCGKLLELNLISKTEWPPCLFLVSEFHGKWKILWCGGHLWYNKIFIAFCKNLVSHIGKRVSKPACFMKVLFLSCLPPSFFKFCPMPPPPSCCLVSLSECVIAPHLMYYFG